MLSKIICIVIGYFVGCVSSAYIVGRIMKTDLRTQGSGNLGSTNALRVLGKKAGLITFVCDIVKAVIAFLLCSLLWPSIPLAGLYGCVGAVIGHDFPFYLHFKGGKGIATMIGMMLCLLTINPYPTLCAFGVGIVVLFTRYVSAGSIAFSLSAPLFIFVFGLGIEPTLLTLFLGLLALWKHKSNIVRLLQGTENRLGNKKN